MPMNMYQIMFARTLGEIYKSNLLQGKYCPVDYHHIYGLTNGIEPIIEDVFSLSPSIEDVFYNDVLDVLRAIRECVDKEVSYHNRIRNVEKIIDEKEKDNYDGEGSTRPKIGMVFAALILQSRFVDEIKFLLDDSPGCPSEYKYILRLIENNKEEDKMRFLSEH